MILFPIAILWLALVLVWVIKQDTSGPNTPEDNNDNDIRRWPRRPRNPKQGPRVPGKWAAPGTRGDSTRAPAHTQTRKRRLDAKRS
jgi:hypothetical protein